MWFDGIDPAFQFFPTDSLLDSPPFDHFADRSERSERSRGPGAFTPLGMAFEDAFGGLWQRFEDSTEQPISDNWLPAISSVSGSNFKSWVFNEPPPEGSGDPPEGSDDDIVVTGKRTGYRYVFDLADWIETRNQQESGGTGPGDFGGDEWAHRPDEESIALDLSNISRPLGESELTAIQNLQRTIVAITAAINALPNDAIVTLPNGASTTGAELKAIWAKTDFIITDGVSYRNGLGGEASMVNGVEPTIMINVQDLDGYDYWPGGMNYLVAHELGHLTQWGTPLVYDQITANDIARALLNGARLPYYANPEYGYSEGGPMEFSVPATSGGSGGGSTQIY